MYLLLCNALLFCFCIHRSWLEHRFNVSVLLYIVCVYVILRKHDDNNNTYNNNWKCPDKDFIPVLWFK